MSVPRPAICVDTVTAPYLPASAMIAASSASLRALRTTHGMPSFSSFSASSSDSATSCVPTRIGRPVSCTSRISASIARSFCDGDA